MFGRLSTFVRPAAFGIVGLLLLSVPLLAEHHESSFSHQEWDKILTQYVDETGMVDYLGLKKNRQALDRYLKDIAADGPSSTPNQFPSDQDALAYYLNAYNAATFHGVLKGGGDQKTVWGIIAGYQFFIGTDYEIDGDGISLKKLEDDLIREQYKDPRIHAALVCASISCPRLRQDAFVGDRLDDQLDEAITEFANQTLHVKVDHRAKKAMLSKIYDWYKDDFVAYEKSKGAKAPSVIGYINRYRPQDEQIPTDYKVSFLTYDKGLNAQ